MMIEPNGCSLCGEPERGHGMRVMRDVRLHIYIEPTNEQRKSRMIDRRKGM